jgi:mRNA interferase RelE/StbE
MNVEFLKRFSKDLDAIKNKSVKQAVSRLIELMETVDALDKIPNTKKLKGHKSAYRTRIADYRVGFFFENSTIYLLAFCIGKTSIKFSLRKRL